MIEPGSRVLVVGGGAAGLAAAHAVSARHRVTLVAFAERAELLVDLGPLRAACAEVELVPTPLALNGGGRDALKRVLALASSLPFGAWKFRSPELTGALERQLARQDFDVLICDGVYNVQNLPAHLAVPVLLNKDDVAHVLIRRYLALEPSAARRLYGALEARKVERWERAALHKAKVVLALGYQRRRDAWYLRLKLPA